MMPIRGVRLRRPRARRQSIHPPTSQSRHRLNSPPRLVSGPKVTDATQIAQRIFQLAQRPDRPKQHIDQRVRRAHRKARQIESKRIDVGNGRKD